MEREVCGAVGGVTPGEVVLSFWDVHFLAGFGLSVLIGTMYWFIFSWGEVRLIWQREGLFILCFGSLFSLWLLALSLLHWWLDWVIFVRLWM